MTNDLDKLRAELDEFAQSKPKQVRAPREERIISGFEEIQRFVDQHGRSPKQGEDGDIFERLYAVRLDRIRELPESRELLIPFDYQGLLEEAAQPGFNSPDEISDDELLAELSDHPREQGDLTDLRHVKPRAEKRAVDEIANRVPCDDFDRFEPLFEKVERELKTEIRESRRFGKDAAINEGEFFILGGQLVYVAEMGEARRTPNGEKNARLRVIYSNKTESNLLLRSLQRALYKDATGRRITHPDAGPLFGDRHEEGDVKTGTIYVLRSCSDHPYVAKHRELIHKIGVTGGKIENRIANASNQSTYLLADVQVVVTYELTGINRIKLENLLHRVLAPAQLDLTIEDRFGKPVKPREWFLVPLHILDDVIKHVRDGSITDVVYDPATAELVSTKG